jgi:hypothetical protein
VNLHMDIDWDGWSPPNSFVCPISGELMVDPVTCVDGHSYEKGCILRWFRESRVTSPVTGIALDSATVFPNHALRNAIEEWKLQLRGGGPPPDSTPAPPPLPQPPRAAPPRAAPSRTTSSPAAVLEDEESATERAIREVWRRRELEARARADEAAEPAFSRVQAAAEFRAAAAARQQRPSRPSRQPRQPRQARQARSHGGASGHAGHVAALAHAAAAAAAARAPPRPPRAPPPRPRAPPPPPPPPRAPPPRVPPPQQRQRQRASSAPPRRREADSAPPSRRGRPSVPPTRAGDMGGGGDVGPAPAMSRARSHLGSAARQVQLSLRAMRAMEVPRPLRAVRTMEVPRPLDAARGWLSDARSSRRESATRPPSSNKLPCPGCGSKDWMLTFNRFDNRYHLCESCSYRW